MDHNPLTPEEKNILIEDALRTYPLAPMPRDITADVMRRIQAVPASPLFRITWSDVVLSFVIALCIGAVWFGLEHLPPLMVARLRMESILFYQRLLVNARWLVPTLLFGSAAFLAALTIPYLGRELMRKSL
ncbi:MAG TPA: hypothetical protein VHP14_00130 [Anaerolineales bacterium]|nr:hypothetical protein [Anaerolineales bacterium]